MNRKPKICMLTLDFPYLTKKGVLHSGGADVIVKELCDNLFSKGFDVTVISSKLKDYQGEVVPYKVIRVSNLFVGFRETKAFGTILMTINSILKDQKFDIVHCHNPPVFLPAFILAKKSKAKLILTMHGPWADLRKNSRFLADKIEEFSIKHSDIVIAVSKSLKKRLDEKYNLAKNKIKVIENGVNTDIFRPATRKEKKSLRIKYKIPIDKKVILYVGRFVKEKRVNDLLETIPLVTEQNSNVLYLLVGGGFDSKLINKWIEEHKDYKKYIKIIPSIPHENIHEIYKCADIFVLPSEAEGMSLSLLEAMASGLVSIVTNISSNTELIQNRKFGLSYSVGNFNLLANYILLCLKDFNLLKTYKNSTYDFIQKKYSILKQVNRYFKIYSLK